MGTRTRAPLLAVATLGACSEARLPPEVFTAAEMRGIDDALFARLQLIADASIKRAHEIADESGTSLAWAWSYAADAAEIMAERTKDERYARLVLDGFQAILPLRGSEVGVVDGARKRAVRTWGDVTQTRTAAAAGVWSCNVCYTGRILAPVAGLVHDVLRSSGWSDAIRAQARAAIPAITAALDEHLGEYRAMPGTVPEAGWFWRPTHDDTEPLNHASSIATAYLLMDAVIGRPDYRKVFEGVAHYFLRAWRFQGSVPIWTYCPTPDDRAGGPPEPFWKAAETIRIVTTGHRLGLVFTEQHVRQIARLFMTRVVLPDGTIRCQLDETYKQLADESVELGLRDAFSRWTPLADVEPRVADAVRIGFERHPDLFPEQWLSSVGSIEAAAYRLAGLRTAATAGR